MTAMEGRKRSRESEVGYRIRGLAREKGKEATVRIAFDSLGSIGVSAPMLAQMAIEHAGGIMSSKEVATALSSHGQQVASTNVGRLIHGTQPWYRVAGETVPLWFGCQIEPHQRRLWENREHRLLKEQQMSHVRGLIREQRVEGVQTNGQPE